MLLLLLAAVLLFTSRSIQRSASRVVTSKNLDRLKWKELWNSNVWLVGVGVELLSQHTDSSGPQYMAIAFSTVTKETRMNVPILSLNIVILGKSIKSPFSLDRYAIALPKVYCEAKDTLNLFLAWRRLDLSFSISHDIDDASTLLAVRLLCSELSSSLSLFITPARQHITYMQLKTHSRTCNIKFYS